MRRKVFVNWVTLSRVPISLLGGILFTGGLKTAGVALILSAVLIDILDGPLARKWDAVTRIGNLLDAFSDVVQWVVVFGLLYGGGISITSVLLLLGSGAGLMILSQKVTKGPKWLQLGILLTPLVVGVAVQLILP